MRLAEKMVSEQGLKKKRKGTKILGRLRLPVLVEDREVKDKIRCLE